MPQNNDTDTKAKTGNNTERQAGNDKKSKNWQEALKVSMSLFIPAFVLMILSFFMFNPALVSLFTGLRAKQVETEVKNLIDEEIKKQLQQEAKNQISQERTKILGEQQALLKLEQESSLGKTYISQEISKQAEEQAKKVAKDEISQAKGDLYGQMTFPVIFAIASIFAAFAVKDILTEVLKEEERKKVKGDIEKELKELIGVGKYEDKQGTLKKKLEESLKTKSNETYDKLKLYLDQELEEINECTTSLQSYTHWLEYQLLESDMNRVINSSPKSIDLIENIFKRQNTVLSEIGDNSKSIKLLKEGNRKVLVLLHPKEKQMNISDSSDENQNDWDAFKTELFNIQLNLLLITLKKLSQSEDKPGDPSITQLIEDIEEFINTDFGAQARKGKQIFSKITSQMNQNIERPSEKKDV
ncbi:MAG: hypothetical protein QNJ49_08645 [Mastigocoleus sp. MO_167.B18]|uniref:hypothetical protein n=1 Tax=Mastigocoleus sp. MO_188.B34 TaxID=3036635 RepID=UPI00261F8831|nr:hypothetical protein [Mastigocoleus sp. MO_188.B34]MDJ0695643.1 hypothetical protein [Mastigocoleus sp. MO_188.B34]MDJ0773483.1 hypothetical protein [Mastigocoleus sp. MO_167.B18]